MEKIVTSAQQRFRLITVGSKAGSTFWPLAALLAAEVLWGASFVAMRVAVTAIGPMAVMWSRMIFLKPLPSPRCWGSPFPSPA
jgi:hypothetical protein